MPVKEYQQIQIPSNFLLAKRLEDEIIRQAENLGYDEESLFAVRLSLEEALTNAIRHGNAQDERKPIQVRYHVDARQIEIFITDQGQGFQPEQVPDPTTPENIEMPSGRGIMLMRAYMNVVEYNHTGNTVHMVKYRE